MEGEETAELNEPTRGPSLDGESQKLHGHNVPSPIKAIVRAEEESNLGLCAICAKLDFEQLFSKADDYVNEDKAAWLLRKGKVANLDKSGGLALANLGKLRMRVENEGSMCPLC
jgi:hypothetical protein